MKKLISAALTISVMLGMLSGCGNKKNTEEIQTSPDSSYTEDENVTPQPDPLEARYGTSTTNTSESKGASSATGTSTATGSAVTTSVKSTAKADSSTTSTTTSANPDENEPSAQPDPLGGGVFSQNSDGTLNFEGGDIPEDDRTLIAAAQALFESACSTEWKFTVGCPYSMDMNDTAENSLGWTMFRITDSNIKSFDDVLQDYHKVFSDRFTNEDLSVLYMEKDGSVYAMNGQRGSDLYYSTSKITAVQSRSDDEIFFTVENYYDGSDIDGSELRTETDTFSIVIESDGTWKAGQFKLPY